MGLQRNDVDQRCGAPPLQGGRMVHTVTQGTPSMDVRCANNAHECTQTHVFFFENETILGQEAHLLKQ